MHKIAYLHERLLLGRSAGIDGIYTSEKNHRIQLFFLFSHLIYNFFFRAVPGAYGSSQGRCCIRAVVASLCHGHSNLGSKVRLWPIPQLMSIGSSTHWARPGIEPTFAWIPVMCNHYRWATMRTPRILLFWQNPLNFWNPLFNKIYWAPCMEHKLLKSTGTSKGTRVLLKTKHKIPWKSKR